MSSDTFNRPKYGLKIFNYEAGSIYSKNRGTREEYRRSEAMLANSLFLDFMLQNGLGRYEFKKGHSYKKDGKEVFVEDKWSKKDTGSWTQDIICINFESGVKSFEGEIGSLIKKMNKSELENKKNELAEELKKEKQKENCDCDKIKDLSNRIKTYGEAITSFENEINERTKNSYNKYLDNLETKNSESIRLKKRNKKIEELSKKLEELSKKLEVTDDENYEEIYQKIKNTEKEIEAEKISYKRYQDYLDQLVFYAQKHEKKYEKEGSKKRSDLRIEYYVNGVEIFYPGKKKPIEYVKLFRSTGKAKNGSCIFIKKKLYEKAKSFLRMGKKFPNEENNIVSLAAYESLVTSNMIGKVKINPDNILVIKDIDVFFKRNVLSVWNLMEKKENKEIAEKKFKDGMKNTLFDGQSLISETVFEKTKFFHPKEDKLCGYILLRNHFFKSAAFPVDMKQFFKDWCKKNGKDYETFSVRDYWGEEKLVKNIELITTENSLKFKKFGFSFEDFKYWCEQIKKFDNEFGVVKTAHPSKLGDCNNMSFQMVNALKYDKTKLKEVTKTSREFIEDLYKDTDSIDENGFIKFLESKSTSNNDYSALVALCRHNPKFIYSKYFRYDRRRHIISDFKYDELKTGRILQNAENLVIVGNPYAMLLATVERKWDEDKGTFEWDPHDDMFDSQKESDGILCYTERFEDDSSLAEFRSPYSSRNCTGYMINKYPPAEIKKYFNKFGRQIIAVNMIGTAFQVINSGSDQDSDMISVMDQPEIVSMAKEFYDNYATVINDIPLQEEIDSAKGKVKTLKELGTEYASVFKKFKEPIEKPTSKQLLQLKYADVDNKLANAQRAIGSSSNNALLCLSYAENYPERRTDYENYAAVLAILAQAAIDNAKREFCIDINHEINVIKQKMDIETNGFPAFWKVVDSRSKYENFNERKCHPMNCAMDYIVSDDFKLPKGYKSRCKLIDTEKFLYRFDSSTLSGEDRKKYDRIEEKIYEYIKKWKSYHAEDEDDSYAILHIDYDKMIKYISYKEIDMQSLTKYLINKTFVKKSGAGAYNTPMLLKTLFKLSKKSVLACFKTEEEMKDI